MSLTVDSGSPVTTNYVWDVNSGLPVILDDGTNQYVYGLDLISATDGPDNQTYFTQDGLGSTTDLTDETGTATDSYSYDVFGAVRNRTGTSTNTFQFTGQQTDADSGMQYLRARSYDPSTGRFLSQDPAPAVMSRPAANNAYSYVGNNPVSWVDPSGKWCPKDPSDCIPDPSDLPDPRSIADPLIDLLPEGTAFQIGPYHISYQLLGTCVLYANACAAAVAALPVVNGIAYSIYSRAELNEGTFAKPKEGDAFQHCFWSGLITLAAGAHAAEQVTSHYEALGSDNDPFQREYDIFNNRRGREFAQYFQGTQAAGALAVQQYCSGGRPIR